MPKNNRRFLVALVSGLAGAAVTGLLMTLDMQNRPRVNAAPPPAVPRLSPEESIMVFEWCVVFYTVVYLVGETLYRRIGATDDLQSLKNLSGAHLPLLHLMGGGILLSDPLLRPIAFNQNNEGARLLMVIGAAMICQAGYRLVRIWRK